MRRRKRRQKRSYALFLIIAGCMVCFLCGFTFRGSVTTAYAEDYTASSVAVPEVSTTPATQIEDTLDMEKYYGSISVDRGDTLYSIAQEYYTSQWGSLDDYVQEIMQVNGLSHDYITQGNYLVIPYYQ